MPSDTPPASLRIRISLAKNVVPLLGRAQLLLRSIAEGEKCLPRLLSRFHLCADFMRFTLAEACHEILGRANQRSSLCSRQSSITRLMLFERRHRKQAETSVSLQDAANGSLFIGNLGNSVRDRNLSFGRTGLKA